MTGPPTSPPDPGPLSTHEHEWQPDSDSLVIEDGAAIFHERCGWAEVTSSSYSEKHDETFYGYGAECEATRSYRFEYSTLEAPDGSEVDVDPIEEWGEEPLMSAYICTRVRIAENGFHSDNNYHEVTLDVDPDPETGQVTITHRGWQLHFRP